MAIFQSAAMEPLGILQSSSTIILVCLLYSYMSIIGMSSAQLDECSTNGHRVIDDPYRSTDYREGSDEGVKPICDKYLERGWYVFKIYGKFAEMPTNCIDADYCGTSAPIWLQLNGESLPLPGENKSFSSCATITPRNAHPKNKIQHCCGFSPSPVTVSNCGEFFVYFLQPIGGCSLAYCAQEVKARCKAGQYSVDGFEPCIDRYPMLLGQPHLTIGMMDGDAHLVCSFDSSSTQVGDAKIFQVNWHKTNLREEILTQLFSEEIYGSSASLPVRAFIQMGDTIKCSVSAFFNHTREFKSLAVDSNNFKAEIKVSSNQLSISENAERHKLTFESTIPVICESGGQSCSIKIPISVDKDEFNRHPDIAISGCFAEIKSRKCNNRNCGKGSVYIKAVTDFTTDGDRVSNLRTGKIVSDDSIWNGYDTEDVQIFVKDVPTAQCYSFTDPHFITFDRLKYDFYKTGTYILHKSLNRDFEVNSRIWNCGGATDEISCNCGFVVRENNDVISVDMCNGVLLETQAEIKIKSSLPLAHGVKIKESMSGKKITVLFPSGAFVRGDISDWGMSITVQVPSSDFNNTCGLCGIFDGDSTNDYHHGERNKMDIKMKHGQANEFVEIWRLRDGGLFNTVPEYKEYSKRKYFCNCEAPNDATVTSNMLSKCLRYDDVIRNSIIKSKDMTTKYKKKSSHTKSKRSLILLSKDDTYPVDISPLTQYGAPVYEIIDAVPPNDGYFFYPDLDDSDLRPITPSWPTPTGITESQALTKCKIKLSNSHLAAVCSGTLGTEMYIDDAIEMCVADLQLTDDFVWGSYAYSLIENECERAFLENQTIWMPNDDTEITYSMYLRESLNCPYNCSGHGKCTFRGCNCDEGFSTMDCSMQYDTPIITRVGANGLCDSRVEFCDIIKVNVEHVNENNNIRCHMSILQTNDEFAQFETVGIFRNKKSILCPMPNADEIQEVIQNSKTPSKWALQISYNSGSLSNAVIATVFDSFCFQCDWQGVCTLRDKTCFIKQTCRSAGEMLPNNDCLKCIPEQDIYEWSIVRGNLQPEFDLPPQVFVFTGNTLSYQLVARDLDGGPVVYGLLSKEDNIHVASSGKLTWAPSESNQVLLQVKATDECGAVATSLLDVTVITCPCQNNGRCMNDEEYMEMEPVCECQIGFLGYRCELARAPVLAFLLADACQPNPCQHGSCSLSTDGLFNCNCDFGFTGLICEQALDPCDPNPCFAGVACSVISHGFRCGPCPADYEGDGISCKYQCSVTCPRNMQCTHGNRCVCKEGWTGFGCSIAICRPDCQNEGKCVAPDVCSCRAGYIGDICEKAVCNPECKHGGICYAPNVCICQSGFVGPRCETMTCLVNCQNGGYCSDPNTCICPEGYTGPTCSQAVCQSPCMNGGICTAPSRCLCSRGYQGTSCQRGICNDPCINGGTCIRRNMCSCPRGYTGKRCEDPLCEPRCLNNGRCIAPNTCSCPSGWRGKHCQKAICNNGCQNGGLCITPNVCACEYGYAGTSCQTPICRRTCMYGGRCIGPDHCACLPGRTGTYCEKTSSDRYYRYRRHYL